MTAATHRAMERTLRLQSAILERFVQVPDGLISIDHPRSEMQKGSFSTGRSAWNSPSANRRRARPRVRRHRRLSDARPPARRAAHAGGSHLSIEGEPRSLTHGRVVTEHDVRAGAGISNGADSDRASPSRRGRPTCSCPAYLGIDFETRGPGRLPAARRGGDVPSRPARPGDGHRLRHPHRRHSSARATPYLFRFAFEGTVDGEPLLTMRRRLRRLLHRRGAGGRQGRRATELRPPAARRRPARPTGRVGAACRRRHRIVASRAIDALARGHWPGGFGPAFEQLALRNADVHLPGGRTAAGRPRDALDPDGGPVRARPHPRRGRHPPRRLVPDLPLRRRPVMPGTLMYECCLHTLRIL